MCEYPAAGDLQDVGSTEKSVREHQGGWSERPRLIRSRGSTKQLK